MSSVFSSLINNIRNGVTGVKNQINNVTDKLLIGIGLTNSTFCVLMFILVIAILVYTVKVHNILKHKDGFAIRGQSYIDGQMLFGDVPEKVSTGSEEYDNPLYEAISSRWEPTDTKVNGYTVWKQRTFD